MELLIGFVGRKRTGKDTLAKMLGDNVSTLSFAGPLKMACKHAYCLTDDQMDGEKDQIDDIWGMSPRDMFKSMGTDYFREIDPEHWLRVMVLRLRGLKKVAISDVRFKNEAQFIKDRGGTLIHVTRDLPHSDTHPTESESDGIICDFYIDNDGSLADLMAKFDELIGSIPGLKGKL